MVFVQSCIVWDRTLFFGLTPAFWRVASGPHRFTTERMGTFHLTIILTGRAPSHVRANNTGHLTWNRHSQRLSRDCQARVAALSGSG